MIASMTQKTAQRLLWGAALFLVPVPLMAFADAFVPTMRLLELTMVIVITVVVEGAHGVSLLLLGLFAAHTLVYAALLWFAARALTGVVERLAPAALGPTTAVVVIVGLIVALAMPVYDTPFHAHVPHASLVEVYR